MKCPLCGHADTKVVDKRETEDLNANRRRRECLKCKKRFTTYERVEFGDLMVVKKDGKREPFDRNKIKIGIVKACEKCPVSMNLIEETVDEIEQKIRNLNKNEIKSKYLGELVMRKLKKIDEVAYIRFASVYKTFKDIESFEKELEKLKK